MTEKLKLNLVLCGHSLTDVQADLCLYSTTSNLLSFGWPDAYSVYINGETLISSLSGVVLVDCLSTTRSRSAMFNKPVDKLYQIQSNNSSRWVLNPGLILENPRRNSFAEMPSKRCFDEMWEHPKIVHSRLPTKGC